MAGLRRRAIVSAILILFIVTQFTYVPQEVFAQTPFVLQSYSYKSSANTDVVYPGSRNTVLTVNVLYNGSQSAYVSAACISLPRGFSVTRGYSSCAPPQTPNGSTYTVVEPGDIAVFTYHIDIGGDVSLVNTMQI